MERIVVYDTTNGHFKSVSQKPRKLITTKTGSGILVHQKPPAEAPIETPEGIPDLPPPYPVGGTWSFKSDELAGINDGEVDRLFITSSVRSDKMNEIKERVSDTEIILKHPLLSSRPKRKPEGGMVWSESEEGEATFYTQKFVKADPATDEDGIALVERYKRKTGNTENVAYVIVNVARPIGNFEKWKIDLQTKKVIKRDDDINE
jgi:hypothetical protein